MMSARNSNGSNFHCSHKINHYTCFINLPGHVAGLVGFLTLATPLTWNTESMSHWIHSFIKSVSLKVSKSSVLSVEQFINWPGNQLVGYQPIIQSVSKSVTRPVSRCNIHVLQTIVISPFLRFLLGPVTTFSILHSTSLPIWKCIHHVNMPRSECVEKVWFSLQNNLVI